MFQVLIIFSSATCFYLASNVLAQYSPPLPHCIQNYGPENSCYLMREVISINNDSYTPRTVTAFIYDRKTKEFTITFDQEYLNVGEQGIPRVTMLQLCHERALQLTVNDLECANLTCRTDIYPPIENSVSIRCTQNFGDLIFFAGNHTIIALRPNRNIQSCQSLPMYLILVDTDGESMHSYC